MIPTVCIFVSLLSASALGAVPFENSKSGVLPSPQECGRQSVDETATVVEGQAALKEFPWVVFIPLESHVYNPSADLRCAGALVSKRHVLFSALCLQFILSKVKVGRHNTSDENVLTVNVESRIVSDDEKFVLAKLAEDVPFSDFIQPICLPWDNFEEIKVDDEVLTSGWGLKNTGSPASETKKKVKGKVVADAECADSKTKSEDLLCVRDEEGAVRICDGDEGGPIMHKTSGGQWVAYGILGNVFEGFKTCSMEKPLSGIKITDSTLRWILSKVE